MGHDMIAGHPRVWSSATPDEAGPDSITSGFGIGLPSASDANTGTGSGADPTREISQMEEHEEFIKTAGIIKKPGIPLGLRLEIILKSPPLFRLIINLKFSVIDRGHDIIIHRILVGGYIEKLGLLKRGDIIRNSLKCSLPV